MSADSELSAVLELLAGLVLEPRTSVLAALLLTALWIDVRQHRIPNWLVATGVAFAVLYNGLGLVVADNTFSVPFLRENGWAVSLQGMALCFGILFPVYLLGAMGAGDVKLMTMVGAFLGPWNAAMAVVSTCLAGGVLALAFLVWKGTMRQALRNVFLVFRGNLLTAPAAVVDLQVPAAVSAGKLPYGVAIASGTIAYMLLKQLGIVTW